MPDIKNTDLTEKVTSTATQTTGKLLFSEAALAKGTNKIRMLGESHGRIRRISVNLAQGTINLHSVVEKLVKQNKENRDMIDKLKHDN